MSVFSELSKTTYVVTIPELPFVVGYIVPTEVLDFISFTSLSFTLSIASLTAISASSLEIGSTNCTCISAPISADAVLSSTSVPV